MFVPVTINFILISVADFNSLIVYLICNEMVGCKKIPYFIVHYREFHFVHHVCWWTLNSGFGSSHRPVLSALIRS